MNEQSGGTVSGQEKRRSELQAFWATQRPKHFRRYRQEYVGKRFKDGWGWAKGFAIVTETCFYTEPGSSSERKNRSAFADHL
jgi:hypothetical protein